MAYKIEYFCVSNIGKCRKQNQDNFICDGKILPFQNEGTYNALHGEVDVKDNPLFGVFDGMGGEDCGEMAAYLAAQEALQLKVADNPENELIKYCKRANEHICDYAQNHHLNAMGTTAALLLFFEKRIYLCNIGDSKIFMFSNRKLEQISFDHVGMKVGDKKPPLLQNLGIPEEELQIEPYLASGLYQKGDCFLLCSDGLTDMVEEKEIAEVLYKTNRTQIVEHLLGKALNRGGKDNISFIVLYIEKSKRSPIFFKRGR